ncbi:hypothetical protein LP417_35030 (plasmid) [Polaromonas sp. P1-6]|nr:hypothetical protein LP417_35030 [Polaromonas sp. P1-6]
MNAIYKDLGGALLLFAVMCLSTAQADAKTVDLSGCTAQTAFSPNGGELI